MSDISKIKVSSVEYDIKDIQARKDLGNLGTRVTELEQHGGGGAVPKPLTYDYMPEGYPTKTMGAVTVMEEQVVEFASPGDGSPSVGALTTTFTPVEGQTYIVNWDGAEHECVCSIFNGRFLVLGNLSIVGAGDDTGEPFIYMYVPSAGSEFETLDTASSHTISVKTTEEIVTPMTEEFLPSGVITAIENAQNIANGAARKSDPVFTGSFSQNRKENTEIGSYSHAEGKGAIASVFCSHAEGSNTTASGTSSHAEGGATKASGDGSHAEGNYTTAIGNYSHAEGNTTKASGDCSHAEGNVTKAIGPCSHAEGEYCNALGKYQHVQGKYNIESGASDSIVDSDYAHIVGNGTSNNKRSNAHTLTWSGVPWYQGRPQFGGTAMGNGAQTVMANGDKEIILASSTEGSTKKFKITVDDSGTLSATEVTA